MAKSMRWRLQAWYGAVLVIVIAGFAGSAYWQARRSRLEQIDEKLAGAARYLDAILRRLPPIEGEFPAFPREGPPPPRGRGDRRPPPRFGEGRPEQRPDVHPEGRPDGGSDLRPERGPQPGPDGRRPPPRVVVEQVLAELDLPPSLRDRPDELPHDRAYFVVWRRDGSVVKHSPGAEPVARDFPELNVMRLDGQPRPLQRGPRREAAQRGPNATLIVVGKPVVRELAEINRFGGQLAAIGGALLVIGLAGGWFVSRGIMRPIDRIAATASSISARSLSGRIDTARLDSELVGLAEVLNTTFARLEEAFARQARFTADASHELRTPLAVLQGQVELALRRPRSAEDYRESLESCAPAIARMRSLLEGLLTLARADGGHLALAFEPLELNQLIEESAAPFRADAEQGALQLTVTPASEPVVVSGDKSLLSRVVANLIANALRHTPAGGRIDVAVEVSGPGARILIADTGAGIPLELQAQVFERFFRADPARTRSSGGNGLGLAICQTLVAAHKGTITFTSSPGEGTTFAVTLPLARHRPDIGAPKHTSEDPCAT